MLFRSTIRKMASQRFIDLAKGHPDSALLDGGLMATGLRKVADMYEVGCKDGMQYGSQMRGQTSFLKSLGDFIERHSQKDQLPSYVGRGWQGRRPDESRLLCTHGISHGMELICSSFLRVGDTVAVEDLTYFLMGHIFRDHGLNVISVPTDKDGLDVAALRKLLSDLQNSNKVLPKMIYTIPTNGNPSAITLPLERRDELLELGKEFGFFVCADEVYHFLDWHKQGECPPRFASIDRSRQGSDTGNDEVAAAVTGPDACAAPSDDSIPDISGRAISLNAFTKILAPGLRAGWIEACPEIIRHLEKRGYLVSQGGVMPFVGDVIEQVMTTKELDSSLDNLCEQLKIRADTLYDTCGANNLEVVAPSTGGYFMLVKVPEDCKLDADDNDRGAAFATLLKKEYNVAVLAGSRTGPAGVDYVRVCFAYLPAGDIKEGVERIGAAAKAVS